MRVPLTQSVRERVLAYCERDLASDANVAAMFDFVDDDKLRERVQSEFQAARYIYKLGEALAASDGRLHAHVKFQIVQFAAIYEVLIVHFLWEKFGGHDVVHELEYHSTYRKAASLPSSLHLTTKDGAPVVLCVEAQQKTPRSSIKFDDKVDAAVQIGFIDSALAAEIKGFYKLRNAIHLETAVKNEVQYELQQSLLAFRRMLPFTRGIRGFLSTGVLPANAKIKRRPADQPEQASAKGED
jgi:hypothetical protein